MIREGHAGCNVRVSELAATFPTKTHSQQIFQKINLEIRSGEIVSVCGLSGIGKSTFLRVLAGLIPPSEGSVTIDQELIEGPMEGLGFVSQDYSRSLFPWLTVEKNIGLPFNGKNLDRVDVNNRIATILQSVGLLAKAKSHPWQLSGGMQQRVAIARALVTQPRLLLLDEPFASVDAYTRLELEDLVLSLAKDIGATTVMVTHDIDEAIYMSDRVVVMTGNPATFTKELDVKLARPRNQMATRSDPEFIILRDDLYLSMRK